MDQPPVARKRLPQSVRRGLQRAFAALPALRLRITRRDVRYAIEHGLLDPRTDGMDYRTLQLLRRWSGTPVPQLDRPQAPAPLPPVVQSEAERIADLLDHQLEPRSILRAKRELQATARPVAKRRGRPSHRTEPR